MAPSRLSLGVALVAVPFSAMHSLGRVAKAAPYNDSPSHSDNAKAKEEGVVVKGKKFICICLYSKYKMHMTMDVDGSSCNRPVHKKREVTVGGKG